MRPSRTSHIRYRICIIFQKSALIVTRHLSLIACLEVAYYLSFITNLKKKKTYHIDRSLSF